MAENYTVNYRINVDSSKALTAIQEFQNATAQMEQLTRRFDAVARSIGKVNSALNSANTKGITVTVNTVEAETKLKQLLGILNQIKTAATVTVGTKASTLAGAAPLNTKIATADLNKLTGTIKTAHDAINGINKRRIHVKSDLSKAQGELDRLLTTLQQIKNLSTIGIGTRGTSRAGTGTGPANQPASNQSWFRRNFALMPNAHQYLGNVYAGTGVGIAGEFIKGLGMTYALSGLIQGVKSIFVDSAEYDNITKTTKNILATHDNGGNFNHRFDEMNRLIRQVGVETKFTAPQVADAGRFLAMAGLNIDEIKSAIRPIADIALVGDTDLGETADVVTNIMTAYEIPAQKMNRVADILTSTFTSANVTLIEMAESFKYSASLFKKAGVPFEVAAASLGILGDAGIKGSQAGTTMRTILSNIFKPTKKQEKAWEEIGVKRLDKNGEVRPLLDLFMDLNAKGLDVKGAYSLFHKTSAQGAVALVNSVDKWNSIIADNFMSDALAQKLANEKKNTIQGLWYQITSAFTESGMQQFEKLQSPIKAFMNQTLDIMKSSEFANSLKSAMSLTMTVVDNVKDMANWILGAYARLGSFFQGWVQFFIKIQMWVGFFNGVQTMLISSFKGLQALYKIGLFSNLVSYLVKMRSAVMAYSFLHSANIGTSIFGVLMAELKAFGRMLMSLWPKLTGFLNTGLLGMLGGAKVLLPLSAIAAIAGGIWWIHDAYSETAEATESYMKSIRVINGISMSEHASKTDKYLQIVYNKQKSANEKLQEYINLRREELGLIKSGVDSSNTQTFGEQFPNEVEAYTFDWRRHFDITGLSVRNAWTTMQDRVKDAAEMLPANSPYRPELTSSLDPFNNIKYHAFGRTFDNSVWGVNRLAAAHLLFTKGANTEEGSEANYIKEEFNERFLRAANEKEIEQVWGAFYKRIDELRARINPNLANLSMDELGKLQEKEWKTSPDYVNALIAQLEAQYGLNGMKTANSIMLNAITGLIAQYANKVIPSPAQIHDALYKMGFASFNPQLGLYDSPQWASALNYNTATGEFGSPTEEATVSRQNVMAIFTALQQQVKQFNPNIQPLFKDLLALPMWNKAGAGLSISKNTRFNAVTGQMEEIEDGDNPLTPLANPLYNGGDQSEYKSHYNTGSAAPKQVIVRIENLMNVQNIDMTDERKAAVVNNLKQELATALLDVVQDFNANMA